MTLGDLALGEKQDAMTGTTGAIVVDPLPEKAADSTHTLVGGHLGQSTGDSCVMNDVLSGMIYASLAITDDKEKTLANVGKTNPWHIEALKLITGSPTLAHQPLSAILQEVMDLQLDCVMNISGITLGGHFLDTQGYIAHNDHVIVLSYRCTTSVFDWLTNFNSTSSVWEPVEDAKMGYSGFCSGLQGLGCCCDDFYKPRVHTGFYNNFLASLPLIKKHVFPLLQPDQPPRRLFVTGHSLGAGIATLAGAYFLFQFDWKALPHTLVNVTAGSPRAFGKAMKPLVAERLSMMGDKARLYRLVNGKDVVTTVPPRLLGFDHLVDPVWIDENGTVIMTTTTSPHQEAEEAHGDHDDSEKEELRKVALAHIAMMDKDLRDRDARPPLAEGEVKVPTSRYDRFVSRVPRALRDHMPDFYLKPLMKTRGVQSGRQLSKELAVAAVASAAVAKPVISMPPSVNQEMVDAIPCAMKKEEKEESETMPVVTAAAKVVATKKEEKEPTETMPVVTAAAQVVAHQDYGVSGPVDDDDEDYNEPELVGSFVL